MPTIQCPDLPRPPTAAASERASIVAAVQPSPAALRKRATKVTGDDGLVHRFHTLLRGLATCTLNEMTTTLNPSTALTGYGDCHPAMRATRWRGESSGFALIVVLWALVLIAFIVGHLTAAGRTEIRIATNVLANAAAEAAADGALFEAIYYLSDPEPARRWSVDGKLHDIIIGNLRVSVRLEDEAWWVNPSTASPALVEALLRATGTDPERARRLAIAVSEWVGSVSVARPQNAVAAEYQAAGLDYAPPGAPLETLDELGRVLGMTPATLAAIRPHLTLFGPPQPSAATLDPFVAVALAETSAVESVPSASQPPPDVLTTRITATAFGSGNAKVTRAAIVRVGAALPSGYQVLARGYGF